MAKPVSPKQRALLEYLRITGPTTSGEASKIIEAATADKRYAAQMALWPTARCELFPALYENERAALKQRRAGMLRDALINYVPEQIIDIKKRITIPQSEAAVYWLDCNHPGWDRELWEEYQSINLDTFCNYYAPAVAATSPELLKKGKTANTKPLPSKGANAKSGCMKTILFLAAFALISPGLYDIGKAVQTRRNADAQARYDAEQIKLAEEKQRTEKHAKIAAAAAELAKEERAKNTPRKQVWSYDPYFGWSHHEIGVSARKSHGL